jgi:signal transduction histidine kinase
MVDLGRRPVGGVVRERLARAVGDPTLMVAYVVDEGRAPVDEQGQSVDLPPAGGARVVTPVDLGGRTVALLIHDPAVPADQISGAASALSVSLATVRLQANIRERVADVQASTRRLLDAADSERRQLASDLRARVDPLLQQAAGELGSEPALLARLDDVRDQLFRLAAGLDPLALHDGGLQPALRELASHAGLPTSVSVEAGRYPPAVESCVWFTCAEAMANAHKHAYATRLDISVHRRDRVLCVEVADDGVGGADANGGSGLRRLAERVRSAGGELAVDSRPGHGTRIAAELQLGAGT